MRKGGEENIRIVKEGLIKRRKERGDIVDNWKGSKRENEVIWRND